MKYRSSRITPNMVCAGKGKQDSCQVRRLICKLYAFLSANEMLTKLNCNVFREIRVVHLLYIIMVDMKWLASLVGVLDVVELVIRAFIHVCHVICHGWGSYIYLVDVKNICATYKYFRNLPYLQYLFWSFPPSGEGKYWWMRLQWLKNQKKNQLKKQLNSFQSINQRMSVMKTNKHWYLAY